MTGFMIFVPGIAFQKRSANHLMRDGCIGSLISLFDQICEQKLKYAESCVTRTRDRFFPLFDITPMLSGTSLSRRFVVNRNFDGGFDGLAISERWDEFRPREIA